MKLSTEEQDMLTGGSGPAVKKAMQILEALGTIYGANHFIPVSSVQISGVSYDNLGEAGLDFLSEIADGGGQAKVITTLNPAGMDIENWQALGIDPRFAAQQNRVIEAFKRMGVVPTCTCTPYLVGNLPLFGEHIAWAESSAVAYANSIIGARTNREGGPSALASSLTGRTPAYGFHLDQNRLPSLTFEVELSLSGTDEFSILGKMIGEILEKGRQRPVPFIKGLNHASLEELKAFCASIATYGGSALFHIDGITPESKYIVPPSTTMRITKSEFEKSYSTVNDAASEEIDFVSLGCPHLTLLEIERIARLLEGKKVNREFWITTSRPIRQIAYSMGYTNIIEASGAKIATDTCCVVAPIQGRFKAIATDSAKACYYAYAKNGFKTRLLPFDQVVKEALK